MRYTEQIFEGLKTYNKNHSFPADQIGMTPAMRELVKSELGVDGIIESFHGVHVNCRDISDKPLFWIGGNVDFYKPKKPVDFHKVIKGVTCHESLNCIGCPYNGNTDCSQRLCNDLSEFFEEKGCKG